MVVIEKNEGKKIAYELTGTKLEFAGGALTIDLARYQQDEPVMRDIMVDSEGYLIMGQGRYYVAQVAIPARGYDEVEIQQVDTLAAQAEGDTPQGDMPMLARTPLPLSTDDVTLYLFGIDGIIIN